MAINAKFAADFSDFYSALQKADVNLKEFEDGAADVERQLTKLGNAFSGVKIIQDAHLATAAMLEVGGTSALTDKEMKKLGATVDEASQKMKKMGLEVPPGFERISAEAKQIEQATKDASASAFDWKASLLNVAGAFGIAFSVNAIKNFVVGIVETASEVGDLSEKLGVSTEAVQRWSYAAKLSGSNIETVDRALTTMNRTLSAGGTGTADILDKIGLSFQTIRHESPEDAFDSITTAIQKIEDPMLRAEAATKLFGKTGAELLPAIAKGFADAAEGAAVMSEDTIKRLKEAEDAWTRLYHTVVTTSGEIIGEGLRLRELFFLMGTAGDGLAGAMERLHPPVLKVAAGLKDITLIEVEVADVIRHSNEEIAAQVVAHEKADVAAKKYSDTLRSMIGSINDVNKVLGYAVAATESLGRVQADEAALNKYNSDVYRKSLEDIALQAQKTYEAAQASSSGFSEAAKSHFAAVAAAARLAADTWESSFIDAGASASAAVEKSATAAKASLASVSASSSGQISGASVAAGDTTNEQRIGRPAWMGPTRALGGPVSAGKTYMVGEKGPELFTPSAGGSISPNGSGASVIISPGAIVLNYPIMSDPRAQSELASIVGAAIYKELTAKGMRVPSGA